MRRRARAERSVLVVGLLVDLGHQAAELAADEVARRDLTEAETQAGHLAGEEFHVGMRLGIGLAVLLLRDAVTGLLTVLREQDERSGVRRLKRQDQRQE